MLQGNSKKVKRRTPDQPLIDGKLTWQPPVPSIEWRTPTSDGFTVPHPCFGALTDGRTCTMSPTTSGPLATLPLLLSPLAAADAPPAGLRTRRRIVRELPLSVFVCVIASISTLYPMRRIVRSSGPLRIERGTLSGCANEEGGGGGGGSDEARRGENRRAVSVKHSCTLARVHIVVSREASATVP